MNIIDGLCTTCQQPIRWLSGTQKLCKTCFQNQQKRDSLIKHEPTFCYTLRHLSGKDNKKYPNLNNEIWSKTYIALHSFSPN